MGVVTGQIVWLAAYRDTPPNFPVIYTDRFTSSWQQVLYGLSALHVLLDGSNHPDFTEYGNHGRLLTNMTTYEWI